MNYLEKEKDENGKQSDGEGWWGRTREALFHKTDISRESLESDSPDTFPMSYELCSLCICILCGVFYFYFYFISFIKGEVRRGWRMKVLLMGNPRNAVPWDGALSPFGRVGETFGNIVLTYWLYLLEGVTWAFWAGVRSGDLSTQPSDPFVYLPLFKRLISLGWSFPGKPLLFFLI